MHGLIKLVTFVNGLKIEQIGISKGEIGFRSSVWKLLDGVSLMIVSGGRSSYYVVTMGKISLGNDSEWLQAG